MRLTSLALICALSSQAIYAADSVDFLKAGTTVTLQHGDQKQTFTDAREALRKAVAGDVVTLGEGTHRGPLMLGTSGVTLTGLPGARVSGNSADWKPQWQKEPAYGPYAYSAAIPFEPVTVMIDQRVMINAEEDRGGLSVHQRGVGRNGRVPLGAVFTWLKHGKRLVVSFASDIDPAKHLIEAAPAGTSAVVIRNANNCTVSNLAITGGGNGVLFQDTKGSTVQKCLIYGADAGVNFYKGANACKLLSCDITWNADATNNDCDPATGDIGNDVWNAHKEFGTYDKFAISIDQTGENNEIAFNYIYDVWDGITTGDGVGKDQMEAHYKQEVLKGISKYNNGLKVHHNRIDLAMDDALEPDNELVNNQWYSNLVTRARCAARLKTIEMGPYFFYNNVLADSGDGLRLYKSAPTSANVFILSNVVLNRTGIIYHAMDTVAWNNPWLKANLAKGTPEYYLYDNVFVCDTAFANHASEKPVLPNYKGDYNAYTCGPDATLLRQGLDKHSTFEASAQFVDAANGNFHLAGGGPQGIAPKDLGLKVTLPPLLASAGAGVGLLANDDQSAPHGPVSGLWDSAKAQLNLGERDVRNYVITPLRWISGGKFDLVLRDLPQRDEVQVMFVRSGSASSSFKLEARDAKGQVLASRAGKSADKDGFAWAIPTKSLGEVRIHIEDDDAAQWRIESDQYKVGVLAGEGVNLRKYDGGRFVFQYPVAAATKSFTVTTHSKYPNGGVEVRRPDGSKAELLKGEVQTEGKAGTYQILVSFTKGGQVTISGPETLLLIDPVQETIPFRPAWGKPKF